MTDDLLEQDARGIITRALVIDQGDVANTHYITKKKRNIFIIDFRQQELTEIIDWGSELGGKSSRSGFQAAGTGF
jgi:hypothetical protein